MNQPVDSHAARVEPPTDPLVELRGIRAAYGNIEVLHGVDLQLRAGEIVALLGPNGAGKSTTIKVLSGLMPPTGGQIFMASREVTGMPAEKLARAGLVTIPEGRGIFPNLTVSENLQMVTYGTNKSLAAIEEVAFRQFPRLSERRGQRAGTMSGGEQQMLAMARGLAVDPAVLVLDELSMGLAPLIVEELYGLVANIGRAGTAILVVEQFAHAVLGIADRALLMSHGRIEATGSPEDIEQRLSHAYLGGAE